MDCCCKSDLETCEVQTEFSPELFHLFAPHTNTSTRSTGKKNCYIAGWDQCDTVHEQDLPFDCCANKPYIALQLMHLSMVESEDASGKVPSRPTSVNGELKRRSKFMSSFNVAIRRSKSSRCVNTCGNNQSQPSVRGWGQQPGLRYDSRFPMLFHGIREIKYDFRPYSHHQQHVDSYRNSYTYILIRNFRELRATGLIGNRLQAALRLNLSNGSHTKHKENKAQSASRQKHDDPPQHPSPIVYFTDKCQSMPVVNRRDDKSRSPSDISPAAGTCFLPKSTMEINSVTLRPSQQRPFGEQDCHNKRNHGVLRSPRTIIHAPGDIYCGRRGCNRGNPINMVTGKSALFNRAKYVASGTRRISPLGRVPVAIRRSSPSIRGKRDPAVTCSAEGVNKFLSIAVATHTVTSPYHSNVLESQDDISLNTNL